MKAKPRAVFLLQMFGIGGMQKWLCQLAKELQGEFDFTFIATHSNYVVPIDFLRMDLEGSERDIFKE